MARAFEERADLLEHDGAMTRTVAERRAVVELAVEWTAAHPEVDALPSAEAKPIAVAALKRSASATRVGFWRG